MKKFLLLLLPSVSFAGSVPLIAHSHVYGTIAANQTVYTAMGDTVISSAAIEAWVQVPFYSSGTFSNMYARLEDNSLSGSCTFYLRINGATATSKVVLQSGVKIGSDTVHTDHINSGDLVDYMIVTGAGTSILPIAIAATFTTDDGSNYQRWSPLAPTGGLDITNGFQPYYSNVNGLLGNNFFENHTYHVMRTSGTFKNLAVYVSTNSRTQTVYWDLRKNGVSTALSTGTAPGKWGLVQQTTTTVSVVVGDTVTFEQGMTNGGETKLIKLNYMSVEFVNAGSEYEYATGTDDKPQNAGETWTIPYKSALTFGGDEYQVAAYSTGTLSNFCMYTAQNDCSTTSTLKFRKNGVTDSNIVMTIPAATTGTFCDNTHTVTVVSSDVIAYIGNSPSGTGTMYYSSIMSKFTPDTSGSGGKPIVTPSLPTVYVSSSIVFSSTDTVSWSLTSGSTGTLTGATGTSVTYNAPGPLRPKQTIYGCITSPQDMIWNTNISSYSTDTSSTSYLRAQAGGAQMSFEPDMPMNIYNDATTTYNMVFNYTPAANGMFKIGAPYGLRMENGIFADKDVDKDTHVLAIDTYTCTASELYKLYPIGTQSDCLSCNSQSGMSYSNGYTINQGVTAGGLPITSLQLKYRELRECVDNGTPIQHALRITFSVGILSNSHIWPAVAHASDGGNLPFGSYVRLVSTYTPTGSAAAQCVQTALKNYGAIVDDGGTNGHIQIEQAAIGDYDLFDALMNELGGLSKFNVSNLEVANVQSAKDTDPTSITYNTGRVSSPTASNFAVVVASNTSSHKVTYMPVIIQPVSIGTEREMGYTFMAGAPQYQVPLWVKGSTDTTFTCSLGTSIGSMTSGGAYTPPSSVIGRSSTTATCTATMDANAKISFPLIIYSSAAVRVRLANASNTDYGPDANGNTWYSDKGSFWRLQGHANCDWSGETWSGVTDSGLYKQCEYVNDGSGDMFNKLIVPNGTYNVKLYFAVGGQSTPFPSDTWVFGIDSQNSIYSGNSASTIAGNGAWTFFGLTGKKIDACNITGSCASRLPGTVTLTPTVSDNNLYFAIRHLTINGSSSRQSFLNAFEITPSTGTASPTNSYRGFSGRAVFSGRAIIR